MKQLVTGVFWAAVILGVAFAVRTGLLPASIGEFSLLILPLVAVFSLGLIQRRLPVCNASE